MRIDVKGLWKTKKKMIIGITAGVAAAAVGCGLWYQAGHSRKEPVYVYPFQYVGMTEFWGDVQESYGPVSTDKIQTVFLSDTQTVTDVFVQEGDAVKKGDLLMRFDTTLSDLQLERKRLEVEKLKLQYADARDELMYINCLKPMKIPSVSDDEDSGENLGFPITERLYPYEKDLINRSTYDGSTPQKALIYWIKSSTPIGSSLFQAADEHAAKIRELNTPEEPGETTDGENSGDTENDKTGFEWPSFGWLTGDQESEQPQSSASASDSTADSAFYVVIKVTAGDRTLGEKKVWQCFKVTKTDGSYSFQFADTVISDYSMIEWGGSSGEDDAPDVDYGSGYTAEQIAQMKSEKQKEIKDLDFRIKMTDAEYKIMLNEVGDGNVYAANDGKVISLLTEEDAKQTRQPVLKVSGGGGVYVEGYVSELEKDSMTPGREVTVNDWNTGAVYTGTVRSVGDFPSREGSYNGNGNPNASYYPFRVFVDETADLQAGSYVSIQYSGAEEQQGIYLENPFLRKEKGESYVLALGKDGKLERRWVTTGKSLWGNYTQILSGLTAEDLVAFPYGKNVKPGVAAQEGDLSNLYG